jgi:phage terminase large subunit-like protein
LVATVPLPVGYATPRLFTPRIYPYSLGEEVADFADIAGWPLMPWQAWLFQAAMELKEPWNDREHTRPNFRYRTIVVLVARQNGKTTVMALRALFGMYRLRELLVMSLAQNLKIAMEAWTSGVNIAESTFALSDHIRTVRRSNGSEQLALLNGARWLVMASNQGLRGLSSDLVLLDEAREQHDTTVWTAADKTRSAKPNSQAWSFSNAGDNQSVLLNGWVDRGRELANDPTNDPSFGFFEWSADVNADPSDVCAWAQANPALGHTITHDVVQAELRQDTMEAFLTERLCIRVTHLGAWLPSGLWESLAQPNAMLPSDARVVFAVDASPNLEHAVCVVAGALPDGTTHVELARDFIATPGRPVPVAVSTFVPGLLDRHPGAEVVYDGQGPLAATLGELAASGLACRALEPADVNRACDRFYELAVSRRLVHRDDAMLAAHVANASPNAHGQAWKFQRRHGSGPINALIAAVMATHVVRAPTPRAATWSVF